LRELTDHLISAGTLNDLQTLCTSGAYLRFTGPAVLAKFFKWKPETWFGTVWKETLADPDIVGLEAAMNAHSQVIGIYRRCLDDCAEYFRYPHDNRLILTRARASREYLEERLI
jgi:hypothetical protein